MCVRTRARGECVRELLVRVRGADACWEGAECKAGFNGCAGSCGLAERRRLASAVGHVVAHGSWGVRVQATRAGCAGSLLCRLVQSVGPGMKEAFERIVRAGRVERTHDEDHGLHVARGVSCERAEPQRVMVTEVGDGSDWVSLADQPVLCGHRA